MKNVENIAEATQSLLELGIKPSEEFWNKAKKRKELTISDPDGYKILLFFLASELCLSPPPSAVSILISLGVIKNDEKNSKCVR